jgi:hypothetical protein
MDPTKEQHQILCRTQKSVMETLTVIRQAFGKESMSRAWKVQTHGPLTSRGLFTKNSSWQAEQSIPSTNMTFYGDCMKMCVDFALNFGDKIIGLYITTTHCLTFSFSPGNFFYRKQHDSSPTHPLEFGTFFLSCFPRIVCQY